jgi:hypothetical protein
MINTIMPSIVNLTCDFCHMSFNRKLKDIGLNKTKNYKSNYCSSKCGWAAKINGKTVSCLQCNISFQKLPSQISKSPNHFCSQSCAAIYRNAHKTHGTRRSKLEVFLEAKLRETYPDLKLLCNDKTAINSELDFYFPDLQLAIELNGILHFEPIYGISKLAQIQSNDNKKSFLCYQKQINLAIIDSSTCKKLTKSAKEKYWQIVKILVDAEGIEPPIFGCKPNVFPLALCAHYLNFDSSLSVTE